jgi:hypothetical protein
MATSWYSYIFGHNEFKTDSAKIELKIDLKDDLKVPTPENQESEFIKQNKTKIVAGFATISLFSLLYSVRKKTRGTSDLGMQRLISDPYLKGNVQHASYIWAFRAFTVATCIVGLGAIGVSFTVSHYMDVSSVSSP